MKLRYLYLTGIIILSIILLVPGGKAGTTPAPTKTQSSGCLKAGLEGFSFPDAGRVGFDVDDTLLFSSPAFEKGFQSGHQFGSKKFWSIVNSSDAEGSLVKQSVAKIVHYYRDRGAKIFVITARTDIDGDKLRSFINRTLGIPTSHIFFEPYGKTERIKKLKLDLFIGDSDGDIEDAGLAGVKALRVIRSKDSSYQRNYTPGRFQETIVPCTER